MEHGSLINQVMADSKPAAPKVGDGATILMWSDRKACTVTEVGKDYFIIQTDKATRTDNLGMSDSQQYSYEADPNGSIYTVRFRKAVKGKSAGYYTCTTEKGPTGRNRTVWDSRVGVGYRDHHYDYSF